ncbi:MAG: PEGA domain-containing protein [Candidatus Omnitrophica bacterium]|nr:PEGA domain-containing protein [Candidatus Omnitrophota bacterium]
MVLLRKIVFYFFVLTYVILCPVIILYALGYIYKPDIEKHIMVTGDMHLSTLPSGASVYINNKIFDNKTPALIEQLSPGEYTVRLFLDGYGVWSEILPVLAGQATVLDKIILIPKAPRNEIISPHEFKNLLRIHGTPFVILAKSALLGDWLIYDRNAKNFYPVIPSGSPYAGYPVYNYFKVKKSPYVILMVGSKSEYKALRLDLSAKEPLLGDITGLFPEMPKQVLWDAGDANNVFVLQGEHVNKLDMKSDALYPEYIKNVRGFGIFSGLIYVLTNEDIFVSMEYNKNNVKEILNDAKLGREIFDMADYYSVMPFPNNVILFIGEKSGELLANRLPYRFVSGAVKGIALSESDGRFLVWRKDKIGILDFSTETTGNVAFEIAPTLRWVFSGGSNIEEAFWVYGSSHVLFKDGDAISIIDIQDYADHSPMRLFTVKSGSSVSYSEKEGLLHYLEPQAGKFMSTTILELQQDQSKK